jgi:ABC-type polysaccharide/polyol phosphate export permease
MSIRTPLRSAAVSPEAPAGTLGQGLADLGRGLGRWPYWWTLTWHSVRSQYRRTYLGPWWMTMQMLVFVIGLSLLFGILLHQDMREFVPYVATGFVCFSWMTGMIQGGATSMVGNATAIKTTPGPLSVYSLQVFARQTIQFGHDCVVLLLIIIVFAVPLNSSLMVLPAALLLICINGVVGSLWLGPLVARFRDVGQIVSSILRVLFFFTPIFWVASDLSSVQVAAIAGWNPLAYLLDLFRSPLLGQWPTDAVWIGSLVSTALNVIIGLVYFSRTRSRVAYWL